MAPRDHKETSTQPRHRRRVRNVQPTCARLPPDQKGRVVLVTSSKRFGTRVLGLEFRGCAQVAAGRPAAGRSPYWKRRHKPLRATRRTFYSAARPRFRLCSIGGGESRGPIDQNCDLDRGVRREPSGWVIGKGIGNQPTNLRARWTPSTEPMVPASSVGLAPVGPTVDGGDDLRLCRQRPRLRHRGVERLENVPTGRRKDRDAS